jgi:hypothetical protein
MRKLPACVAFHANQHADTTGASSMTAPGTDTSPVTTDADSGEGDGYAHYARKEEITRAAIEGGTITALCGFRFPPIRDPQRFPVCPRCKELAAMLWGDA